MYKYYFKMRADMWFLFSLFFFFLCFPLYAGTDAGSHKVGADASEMSEIIERPLLRPVKYQKEGKEVSSDNLKGTTTAEKTKEEKNMDYLLRYLEEEREKLQELEEKYMKLEGVTAETGVAKYFKTDTGEKTGKSSKGTAPKLDVDDLLRGTNKDKSEKKDKSAIISDSYFMQELEKGQHPMKGTVSSKTKQSKKNKNKKTQLQDEVNKAKKQFIAKIGKGVSPVIVAECFYKLGEYESALQSYKDINQEEVPPDQYIWVQYQIANCYRNMDKYDQAIKAFQKFVDEYPDSYLVDQARWYIEDINWWKTWEKKNTTENKQFLRVFGKDKPKSQDKTR